MNQAQNDFWLNKKVLITGHSGFKGSWLSLLLLQKGSVVMGVSLEGDPTTRLLSSQLALSSSHYSPSFSEIAVDLRSKQICSIVAEFQPDIIFHLAAQALVTKSYKSPVETWETNVLGTVNLLHSLQSYNKLCSVVIVTSDKVYENKGTRKAYEELDKLGGLDPYSASKASTELLVSSWINSFTGPEPEKNNLLIIAAARAGNVIGGGDWSDNRIIPDCVKAIESNREIYLRNPEATRPWQHVLDPLSGYIELAKYLYIRKLEDTRFNTTSDTYAFNFGPNEFLTASVQKLVQLLLNSMSLSHYPVSVYKIDGHLHESSHLSISSNKSLSVLGWSARWNLPTTIERTAAWYSDYLNGKNALALCERDINAFNSNK